MNRMDVQMDVQMEGDNFDQRSEHVEQTYHDHRTQQQLNVLSVGVNPAVHMLVNPKFVQKLTMRLPNTIINPKKRCRG